MHRPKINIRKEENMCVREGIANYLPCMWNIGESNNFDCYYINPVHNCIRLWILTFLWTISLLG